MAIMEAFASHVRRNEKRYGCAAVALAFVAPAMACASPGSKAETAEYSLDVDCATDPAATATRRIVLTRLVQQAGVKVTGPGYADQMWVRIFPPASDQTLARQDGTPYHLMKAGDLATGEPQTVKLPHGALTTQQVAPEASDMQVSPSAEALPPTEVSPGPKVEEVLAFTLSCEQPEAAVEPQPR